MRELMFTEMYDDSNAKTIYSTKVGFNVSMDMLKKNMR